MWKKHPQKLLIIRLNFFQYCQLAQNQSKSQFLFHKNCSTCNLSIMTLFRAYLKNILKVLGGGNSGKIPSIEYIQDLNFSKFILGNQISAVVQLWPQWSNIYYIPFIYYLSLFISQQKLGRLFNREKFSRGSRSYLVVTCDVNMLQMASKVQYVTNGFKSSICYRWLQKFQLQQI